MTCQYCKSTCQKAGRQKNGFQRLYCKHCRKYQQVNYIRKAYQAHTDVLIQDLICEGVGIRGASRILKIAVNTIVNRIRKIAGGIPQPAIENNQTSYEVDELWTYI